MHSDDGVFHIDNMRVWVKTTNHVTNYEMVMAKVVRRRTACVISHIMHMIQLYFYRHVDSYVRLFDVPYNIIEQHKQYSSEYDFNTA